MNCGRSDVYLIQFDMIELSVNCCRSEVYLIHLYVIEFVSELLQVSSVLDTSLCERICQ